MNVILSELARAGLARAEPDLERQAGIASSIKLHVAHPDAPNRSYRLAVPANRTLFMYPLYKFRVTWELEEDIRTVWSIKPLRSYEAAGE